MNIPDASIDGFVIDMSRDPTLVKSDNLDWKSKKELINKLTDANRSQANSPSQYATNQRISSPFSRLRLPSTISSGYPADRGVP